MKSQHLLSNDQHQYLTSQTDVPNPSEQRGRIEEKVNQAFATFDIIWYSDIITQDYKDKLFSVEKLMNFLDDFTRYDNQNNKIEEQNKQEICKMMVEKGLSYFQDRYKGMELIKDNLKQANSLLNAITFLTSSEITEKGDMEFYRARKRSIEPQLVIAEKDYWVAECKYCFNTSIPHSNTKHGAIKNLKHTKACRFTKAIKKRGARDNEDIIQRYIISYPPSEKTKKGIRPE